MFFLYITLCSQRFFGPGGRTNDPVELEVTIENKYDHRVTVDINATVIPEN